MRAQRFRVRSCGVGTRLHRYNRGVTRRSANRTTLDEPGVVGGGVRSAPRRRYIFHANTSSVTHTMATAPYGRRPLSVPAPASACAERLGHGDRAARRQRRPLVQIEALVV